MIDTPFRRVLARSAPVVVRLYSRLGLTPNAISLGALLLAAAAAWACGSGCAPAALILWWSGRLLDGTDGIYARGSGQASDFGAYLDIVGDMAAYSLMVFGFLYRYPDLLWTWTAILFFYVLCISSALALGALSEKRGLQASDNRGLRLGAGLAEGGETGIAYTLFLLFPEFMRPLTSVWVGILLVTVLARTALARQILK